MNLCSSYYGRGWNTALCLPLPSPRSPQAGGICGHLWEMPCCAPISNCDLISNCRFQTQRLHTRFGMSDNFRPLCSEHKQTVPLTTFIPTCCDSMFWNGFAGRTALFQRLHAGYVSLQNGAGNVVEAPVWWQCVWAACWEGGGGILLERSVCCAVLCCAVFRGYVLCLGVRWDECQAWGEGGREEGKEGKGGSKQGGRGREGGRGSGCLWLVQAPQRHLPAGLQRNAKPNHLQVKDRRRKHGILSQGLNSSLSAWLLTKLWLSASLCLLSRLKYSRKKSHNSGFLGITEVAKEIMVHTIG